MQTLLQKAKKFQVHTAVYNKWTLEDVELAVAFLKGEVTLAQTSEAWGIKKQNTYAKAFHALKNGVKLGNVTVSLIGILYESL